MNARAAILFLLFLLSALSQQYSARFKIDTLKKILLTAKDAGRINIMNLLSSRFLYRIVQLYLLVFLLSWSLQVCGQNISFKKITPPKDLPFALITGITQDNIGYMWFTSGPVLYRYNGYEFITYKHDPLNPNSLAGTKLDYVYADKSGFIWIGDIVAGLDRLDPKTGITGTFTHYPINANSTHNFDPKGITAILQDSWNMLWVGTDGLYQLNKKTGKFKNYINLQSEQYIQKIYQDTDSILWVGAHEGLYKYNRATDSFYLFPDPVLSIGINNIDNILEDDQKNLWLTVGSGIMRINAKRDETYIYGVKYGIPAYDINFFSGYKGEKGEFFFGNATGYYAFFPETLTRNNKPPQLVITDFRIGEVPINPGEGSALPTPLEQTEEIRLTHDQNNFSFNFAGIHYSDPEENVHLFMLEGYNSTWRRAGAERTAYYLNVPPGSYVFRVKAASSEGIWAEKFIKIIITPPWWNTWLFRITAVMCVVALLYGLMRWRIYQKFRQQLEHAEKEKQLADLRQKAAELQQQTTQLEVQALRAQMNPHFIFNCLNAINRFILTNESEIAANYLTKFSRLIRMVLNNSREAFIPLEDELITLQLYIDLEKLRFKNSFDYIIKHTDNVNAASIAIPPLLLQPFVENAIWHGLMHKESGGKLEIIIDFKNDFLCCTITDNGVGREKALTIKSKSAEKNKSMGLQITKSRMALLNSTENAHDFTIDDLIDENGNAKGTSVFIKIKCKELQDEFE